MPMWGVDIKRKWLIYNSAMLIGSAVLGPWVARGIVFREEGDIFGKAFTLGAVCAVAVLIFLTASHLYSDAGEKWIKPSLKNPPQFIGQPLQLFYLGSINFLAISAGCFIGSYWLDSGHVWVLFASIGFGCLAGTLLSGKLLSSSRRY